MEERQQHIRIIFANRLRMLRREHNMTQKQLAGLLGIHSLRVTAWELAQREAKYVYLLQIAEIFGVSVDYLLGYSDW